MTKTFTILHTNDIHSNLIGVGPASEYTPETVNDDRTIGGIERIATLVAERRRVREADGPVLVLDIGDASIGTPFGGAFQKTGTELQCLSMAGYDATTFGNHDFDFGPAALANAIAAARNAGRVPAILAANTNFDAADAALDGLKSLGQAGTLRTHIVLERGGIRFGLFGMMGADSIQWTINPGALTFPDPIATARAMVQRLRADGAEVIICMSHGGVREPPTGPITEGDDVNLARAVPEIDVIVGGHTHTFMRTPVVVNGTPIVQAGCYGQAVGELVIRMEGTDRTVVSYELHAVDDTIPGDVGLAQEMKAFAAETSRIVFAPRGLRMDEPIVVIDRDWPNTFFDLDASRPLGNLTADAIRQATGADVAVNAAGMVRAGLMKGTSGVQTAYDIFLIAPLGIGVADQSAGGSLVRAYVTGREIKHCLEFLLPGNPNLPGQVLPSRVRHAFRVRPRSPTLRRGDGDRARRSGPWLSRHRHLRDVGGALQPGVQPVLRHRARLDTHEDQRRAGGGAQEEGWHAARLARGRAARRAVRPVLSAPQGYGGQGRGRVRLRRRVARDQGMASDHELPEAPADEERPGDDSADARRAHERESIGRPRPKPLSAPNPC